MLLLWASTAQLYWCTVLCCWLYLYVGMFRAGGAPLSCTALLFAMLEKLKVPHNGDVFALVLQRRCCAARQALFGLCGDGQDDGHGEVDWATFGGRDEWCQTLRLYRCMPTYFGKFIAHVILHIWNIITLKILFGEKSSLQSLPFSAALEKRCS